MGQNEMPLPSNRKFGLLFSGVTAFFAMRFIREDDFGIGAVFVVLSAAFLVASLVKPDALAGLNAAWMRLGHLMGKIVSPVVLGVIYFLLVTPMAFFMRLSGRDPLCLSCRAGGTHWKIRENAVQDITEFKNQY